MKKLSKIILALFLILALLPFSAFATTETPHFENVIYFDDGSYMTVELSVMESRASGTKNGSKTYRYYANDGTEEWRAVLSGTFTYTGSSATCTASSCSVTITNTAWYTVSKTATKSGSNALGTVVMGRKVLGITIAKETYNMQITCDANGNLS